jgi:hypothetical protein
MIVATTEYAKYAQMLVSSPGMAALLRELADALEARITKEYLI